MSKLNQENLLDYLETYVTDKRKDLFKKVLDQRTKHFTVVLEDIYQPHNSSAVMRSCDIFGVQDIHVIENDYVSRVSKHVARGAQKWLTFHHYSNQNNNTLDCIQSLKENNYQIIATTPHNESCLLPDFDISKKTAFVFGREKEGVSQIIKDNSDGFLKIPMVGFTESLNISVAAAVILNDVMAKLKSSSTKWQLDQKEKEELYLEWIEKSIKNVDKIKEYYFKNIII